MGTIYSSDKLIASLHPLSINGDKSSEDGVSLPLRLVIKRSHTCNPLNSWNALSMYSCIYTDRLGDPQVFQHGNSPTIVYLCVCRCMVCVCTCVRVCVHAQPWYLSAIKYRECKTKSWKSSTDQKKRETKTLNNIIEL